ncbi:MAG: AbrB/MazE/SpoVT family DNA-binding domain-containing protein [Proteobacteria bacterium]|nr:AbrB/MazE/SpoVT family DNA-binding domain-containing protein [Pseudomonadota bacterium]
MLAKVTTKGQVTIPKGIRDAFGIRPNDKVDFEREGEKIMLVPLKTLKDLRGAVKPKLKMFIADEKKAAKAAVAKRVMEEMR